MNKQVVITNGTGSCGKDTFAIMLDKYIPTVKYSSIDKVKEIAELGGYNGGKSEKDRRFLSDLKILFSEYNDLPFKDVKSLVDDFNANILEGELLLVDIREPNEIERAKKEFNAKTILVVNTNVNQIKSNMADANVFNYEYDYVIKNNGTLADLEAQTFICYENFIKENLIENWD